MPQLSRPFQIVLVVFVLFAALWFAVLRGHSAGNESSSPSPSAASTSSAGAKQATPSSANAGSPASKGSVYHGSAPGVEGLSRAIQKARGAVAQSQQDANQQQQKSAQASSQTQGPQAQNSQAQASQQTRSSKQTHSRSSSAHGAATKAKSTSSATAEAHSKAASGIPAMQATVEGELHQGKVVAVLFFNPKGSVDNVVRRELQRAGHSSHGKLAVHVASAKQVGAFGSFTRTVQVYSTPTILLINKAGVTSSLTGLTDAFSIEQAVREVKAAK
ncbi:MAG TPA: hypothetical protein VGI52_04160 [Solirubrobacteraceae bacterium]|jgi:hypothetical protein